MGCAGELKIFFFGFLSCCPSWVSSAFYFLSNVCATGLKSWIGFLIGQIPLVWTHTSTHIHTEMHLTTQTCTILKCTQRFVDAHIQQISRETGVCTHTCMYMQINSAPLPWNVNTVCNSRPNTVFYTVVVCVSVFMCTLTFCPLILVLFQNEHRLNSMQDFITWF